jgi:hypothetical protein
MDVIRNGCWRLSVHPSVPAPASINPSIHPSTVNQSTHPRARPPIHCSASPPIQPPALSSAGPPESMVHQSTRPCTRPPIRCSACLPVQPLALLSLCPSAHPCVVVGPSTHHWLPLPTCAIAPARPIHLPVHPRCNTPGTQTHLQEQCYIMGHLR